MSRSYEYIPDDDEREKRFLEDSAATKNTPVHHGVVDVCPLCIEGGPYKLIYGKDEVGYPVKMCPQCKMIIPIHTTGKISDDDITTSQTSRGSTLYRGIKLTDLVNKDGKNKSKPSWI